MYKYLNVKMKQNTNLMQLNNLFLHKFSLHVSGIYMPIVRSAVVHSCIWCTVLGITVVILGSRRAAFYTVCG
jgi:hypothetical protein